MGKKVLVVEDDAAISEAICMVIEGEGYSCVVVNKRKGLATSIVMVTARASAKRVLKSGLANAFLEKPYEMSDLIEVVNKEIK